MRQKINTKKSKTQEIMITKNYTREEVEKRFEKLNGMDILPILEDILCGSADTEKVGFDLIDTIMKETN